MGGVKGDRRQEVGDRREYLKSERSKMDREGKGRSEAGMIFGKSAKNAKKAMRMNASNALEWRGWV